MFPVGRIDDIIVHSTGEKTQPIPMEESIKHYCHAVDAAVVGGNNRFNTYCIVELKEGHQRTEGTVQEVYKAVQRANQDAPAHSRVVKEMLYILPSGDALPRTDKGNVNRKVTESKYTVTIDGLYTSFSGSVTREGGQLSSAAAAQTLTFTSAPQVKEFILKTLSDMHKQQYSDGNPDFQFKEDVSICSQGADSLLATQYYYRVLRTNFHNLHLPSNMLYVYNNINSLANQIYSLYKGESHADGMKHENAKHAEINIHTLAQPSILTSDATKTNFRGLYNLAGIILVSMIARLVVENLLKYGWLLTPSSWLQYIVNDWNHIYPSMLLSTWITTASPSIAYVIEYLASKHCINNHIAAIFHIVHCTLLFILPQAFILYSDAVFLSSVALMLGTLILWLKMISYAHVSHDIRRELQRVAMSKKNDDMNHNVNENNRDTFELLSSSTDQSRVPISGLNNTSQITHGKYNPSFSALLYFILAPTLIYQTSYPRSKRIRIRFCLTRLFEMLLCLSVQVFIIQQYIIPTINNTLPLMSDHTLSGRIRVFERTLKLAVPNAIFWLLMFYSVFHSALNLQAELLRFGDRAFYKEWWNSQDLATYWRTWNLLVHNFVMKHLFEPCMRAGFSDMQVQIVAFTFSAVLHEILISVPTRMFSIYAFLGMFLQVPLVTLTRWLAETMNRPVYGNLVFWISFLVFGQPIIILLYCFDYFTLHRAIKS
jgi:diacylglycerol O-acyltransferase-1